jgi:serine/threonine protein kinase
MLHLHTESVSHRDLAARNILLGDDGTTVKISDFGLSRVNHSTANQTVSDVGPLKHMAPECLLRHEYSEYSDAWAFAITCIEIIIQKDPYPEMDPVMVATQVVSEKGLRHPIPKGITPALGKILTACFAWEPKKRPTFEKICGQLMVITQLSTEKSQKEKGNYGSLAPGASFASSPSPSNQRTPSALYGSHNMPPLPPNQGSAGIFPTPVRVKSTMLPTPPVLDIKPGDKAKGIWQDGQWYDVTVTGVDEKGNYTVTFMGYGDIVVLNRNQIKKS